MKTQELGWLVVGVLAAGLNASYHDGGLQWAHRVANRVGQRSEMVVALARGRADLLMAKAEVASDREEAASCPLSTAFAQAQSRMARAQVQVDRMTAHHEVQFARLEANRDRMQAQIEAQTARIRISSVAFRPVVVRVPQISACPRIRVSMPQPAAVRIPAPVVNVESGDGPI